MGCPWVSEDWRPVLEEDGWRGAFYYVIFEGESEGAVPTVEQLGKLQSEYGIEHDLYYDPDRRLLETCLDTTIEGLPTVLVVNPDNMLVWCSTSRWMDDLDRDTLMLLSVCEEGAAHDPGYRP